MRLAVLCFMVYAVLPSVSRAQAPPFDITTVEEGSIKFDVEASVSIKGAFDKPDATPIFAAPDLSAGVLEIKTQAASYGYRRRHGVEVTVDLSAKRVSGPPAAFRP